MTLKQTEILDLLNPALVKLIQEKGWKTGLLPIQRKAITTILGGDDCIIEAPTAGGKTEAVLFPTLSRASRNKKSSVQILYIAPLRALLNDITKRAEEYSNACSLHCFKWHGDVGQKEKIDEFQNPSQLLLTTPESLEAILLRKANWHRFFTDLECVIIDEAHNFASGDRGSHLISLLERVEHPLENIPQRIAITATIGNPSSMLEWLAGSKRKPGKGICVTPDKATKKDFLIQYFNPKKDVEDNMLTPSSYLRSLNYLYNSLPNKKSLIFRGSRSNTEAIATDINKLNKTHKRRIPVKVRTHHSAVSKYYREYAESRIKIKNDLESSLDAIISTSTLELGIDIGSLDQVIQYGTLTSSSAFLQRVGRTGRRKNKAQFFRGLSLKEDDLILMTAVVNLGLKGISEKILHPRKAYHILAHQLICLCLQCNGVQPSYAWEILSVSQCFSEITERQFLELINFMLDNHFLRKVDDDLVIGETGEKTFLGSNWRKLFAVFESAPMYDVYDGKKHIGTLDSGFVESLDVPFVFVLGGIEWQAHKVKTESRLVLARKTVAGEAPKWSTFYGLDVPFETAQEAGRLLFSNTKPDFLNKEAEECLNSEREKIKNVSFKIGKWIVIMSPKNFEIWTFAGDKINRTLSKMISGLDLGNACSSYKTITVKTKISNIVAIEDVLLKLFTELRSDSLNIASQANQLLMNSLRLISFSKFSKCLPDNLCAEALSERVFDYKGLVREVKNNKIEITSYN